MGMLIGIVLLIILCIVLFFLILSKIDDWAHSDPAINEIFDYSDWKRNEMGVHGYITPAQDDKLRRIYDRERGK
jgi:predicted acetyltransferase